MIGRRLEYHSQKAVLLHMDANVRFKISLHMPSIRKVEKVVPLKMNSLYFTDVSTWVNDTFYEVEVDRLLPDGSAPEDIFRRCDFDYDDFGFPFVTGHDVLLPGDVSFQKENEKVRFDTEEEERVYREGLRNYEKALERLNYLNSKGVTVEDHLKNLENVPVESEEDREIRSILCLESLDSGDIARSIDGFKQELLPFDCRRNNSKRQFNCYITLYTHKEEASTIKRFEYNKKLFEASKYLNEVLFGGRAMPIRVGELSLGDYAIHRLPVGFRLQVRQLLSHARIGINHKNLPFLVENLESLDCLKVYTDDLQFNRYKSQIVRNAKKLVIETGWRGLEGDVIFRVIGDLLNREIGIQTHSTTWAEGFYTTTIQNWLNEERQDGACLWMETGSVETGQSMADRVLKWIETRYERSERNERCVTVSLSNSTVMEVCSVPFKDSSWMLKLNVLKVCEFLPLSSCSSAPVSELNIFDLLHSHLPIACSIL